MDTTEDRPEDSKEIKQEIKREIERGGAYERESAWQIFASVFTVWVDFGKWVDVNIVQKRRQAARINLVNTDPHTLTSNLLDFTKA